MTYQAGITAFKSGDYQSALTELHQAVEEDDQNHKAWNALGVVLTKTGDFETADTCYDNALTIAPDVATYKRNRDKNRVKWYSEDPIEVEDEPKPRPATVSSKYIPNWLLLPLFLVPVIAFVINWFFGFLVLLGCVWYVKRDADSLNAGSNTNAPFWEKFKGWEWAVLLFFFWFFLIWYFYKRDKIYEKNLGYGVNLQYDSPKKFHPPIENSSDAIWNGVKILGGVLIGIFVLFAIVMVITGDYPEPEISSISSPVAMQSESSIPITIVKEQGTSAKTQDKKTYYFNGASSGSTDYFYLDQGVVDILFNVENEYYNGATLKDRDGNYMGLVINQAKSGTGSKKVKVPKNGNYYLDIASENWDIKIIQ